jgi:transcription initiation factor TFIIIB Brf1 subunit/transcription initiation factor TFIIB
MSSVYETKDPPFNGVSLASEPPKAPKKLTKSKLINRSILPDMKDMEFPDDIKQRANNIYQNMHPRILRRERRMLAIFYCIYIAHFEIKNAADPNKIATLVNIKTRDITRALSSFSEVQTGYSTKQIFQTAKDFISDFCDRLKLSKDSIDEINEMYDRVSYNDKTVCDEKPQKVAIATICYWLKTAGVNISDEDRVKVLGPITPTDPLIKRIQTADNAISPLINNIKTENKIVIVLKSKKDGDGKFAKSTT